MTFVADLERHATARVFAAVAVLAGALPRAFGARMTILSDERAFIESRSLADPLNWLQPHNEHWSTLPITLYRLMVDTIGIGSHIPANDPAWRMASERGPWDRAGQPGNSPLGQP